MLRFIWLLFVSFSLSMTAPLIAQETLSLEQAQVYPRHFITDEDRTQGVPPAGGRRGSTTTWYSSEFPEMADGLGFAGYWIDLPALEPGRYEIQLDFGSSAYELVAFPKGELDKALRYSSGQVGERRDTEIPLLKKKVLSFQVEPGQSWVLTFNLSNHSRTFGGFWNPPRLAPAGPLGTEQTIQLGLHFAVCGAMLIIMVYVYMLFNRRRSDLPSLFLALTCLAVILRIAGIESLAAAFVSTVHSRFIFELSTRLEYGSMALVCITFVEFLRRTFPTAALPRWVLQFNLLVGATLVLAACLLSTVTLTQAVGLYQVYVLAAVVGLFTIAGKAYLQKVDGAGFVLLSSLVPLSTSIFDVFSSRAGGAIYISHFGGATFIFLQSQILAKRFAAAYDKAEHLSRHLAQEVEMQTLQIRNIMDNVPEGLFTLGRDLRIQGHCSKYVNQIFPRALGNSLPDLLMYHTTLDRSTLDMTVSVLLSIIGEDEISWDINRGHLFAEAETHDRRLLEFQWHPISQGLVITEMLVIIRDVTELRELRNRTQHQQQEMVLISALAKAKSYRLQTFLEQAKDISRTIRSIWEMNASAENQSYIRIILALLHTLKGDSRQIGFSQLARDVHAFEQNIVDLRETHGEQGADFSFVLDNGLQQIQDALELIETLYRRYWGSLEAPREKFAFAKEDVQLLQEWIDGRRADAGPIKALLRTRMTLPLMERFQELQSEVYRLAGELGKAPPRLHVEMPENVWLNDLFQRTMLSVFGHMIRNSLDHGIENAQDRIEAGKHVRGLIEIRASWQGEDLEISVQDDGRGVDLEALRSRAGLSAPSGLNEQLKLILVPGLSSAATVSEISGRGVGMDAVQSQVEELGGTLKVEALGTAQKSPRFVPFRLVMRFSQATLAAHAV